MDSNYEEYHEDNRQPFGIEKRDTDRQQIDNNRGSKFCHFYNRNGCTRSNCEFIHDVAPTCWHYMNTRCTRRFCGFIHPKKHREREDQGPSYAENFQNRRPIHPGEKRNPNQPRETRTVYNNKNMGPPLPQPAYQSQYRQRNSLQTMNQDRANQRSGAWRQGEY